MNDSKVIKFLPDLVEIGNSSVSREDNSMHIIDSLSYANKPSKISSTVKTIQNSTPVSENLIKKEPIFSDQLYSTLSLSEGTILKPWKNIANIPSKILDIYDDIVLVECLADKEQKQYVETEFPFYLFKNFEIVIGGYCIIMHYQRDNALQVEINANPSLDLSENFPSFDFVQEFKDSKIFKRT